jgi:hypothetical protein
MCGAARGVGRSACSENGGHFGRLRTSFIHCHRFLPVRHEGTPAAKESTPTAFDRRRAMVLASMTSPHSRNLGHSSIQTTERYLGSEQEIAVAATDRRSL